MSSTAFAVQQIHTLDPHHVPELYSFSSVITACMLHEGSMHDVQASDGSACPRTTTGLTPIAVLTTVPR